MAFCAVAVHNAGGSVYAANHLEDWVKRERAYEEIVYREYFVPCSPFCPSDPVHTRNGTALREDLFVSSLSLFLSFL